MQTRTQDYSYKTYQLKSTIPQTLNQPNYQFYKSSSALIDQFMVKKQKQGNMNSMTLQDIKSDQMAIIDTFSYNIKNILKQNSEEITDLKYDLAQSFSAIDQKIKEIKSKQNQSIQKLQLMIIKQVKHRQSKAPKIQLLKNSGEWNKQLRLFKEDLQIKQQSFQDAIRNLKQQLNSQRRKTLKKISNSNSTSIHIKNQLFNMEKLCNLPPYRQYQYPQKREDNCNKLDKTTIYNVSVNLKTFQGLQVQGWLTSSVIINYIQFLKDSSFAKQNNFYVLNESQTQSLADTQNFYKDFPEKKMFIDKYAKVGLLINKNNSHWYFIGVDNKQKVIVVYDSLNSGSEEYYRNIRIVQNCIRYEIQQNKYKSMSYRTIIKSSNTVQQRNGSDCGVCSIINMTYFFSNMFSDKFEIEYDLSRINKIRIGLHFFIVYLVYCKETGTLANMDFLAYCTFEVIKGQKWMSIF